MLGKVINYTYEAARSIAFLIVGLLALNFVQQTLITKIQNEWTMLIVLIADLIILFVINRQFILKEKLSPKTRNLLLFTGLLLITLANILTY